MVHPLYIIFSDQVWLKNKIKVAISTYDLKQWLKNKIKVVISTYDLK